MRYILFCILSLFTFTSTAIAQESDVRQVIQNQIEAFQRNDVESAFEFAAPSIKSIFGNSKRFGMMVQRGYPMVFKQRNLTFKEHNNAENTALQDVLIEDMAGELHLLRYAMILLDGEWKIAGVELLRDVIVAA